MKKAPRKYSLARIIAFNLALLVIILMVGELAVRLIFDHVPSPEEVRQASLEYEPSIFSRHVLAQKEKVANGVSGQKYYINELGYRGLPFKPDKPQGTIRIMMYGGSQVFDSAAPLGEDWPHRVGLFLRRVGFTQVEVINAGIPGQASFDSVGRLFAEGHLFRPDYVLLVNAWNDIKFFREKESLLRLVKPYNDRDDPRISYQGWVDSFLGRRSQIYLRLRRAWYRRKLNLGNEGINKSGPLKTEITEEALRQYKLNWETFVDMARNIGAEPVLITQPRLVTDSNTAEQRTRIMYGGPGLTHQALVRAFNRTDEIIREVAAEKGAILIDASAAMTGQDTYFWDHIHFLKPGSVEMSRIVAIGLAKHLSARTKAE